MDKKLTEQAEKCYREGNYQQTSSILRMLLKAYEDQESDTTGVELSINLGCSLCMEEKYEEAAALLEPLLKQIDKLTLDEESEKKLYCASALCFFQTDRIVKALYAISLYLRLVERTNPEEYSAIKNIL